MSVENSNAAVAGATAQQETPRGFEGWGQSNSEETENIESQNDDDQNEKSKSPEKGNNVSQDDDFNKDSFLADYKQKNPEATQEQIDEAADKAEDKFYSVSADIFSSDNKDKKESKNTFVDQLKSIEGEDFDVVKYGSIESKEDFDNALNEIVDNRVQNKVKEQKAESDYVKNMNETDRAMLNVLKDKGLKGLKDILTPNQKVNEYRSMDNESLVIIGLRNQKNGEGKQLYTDEEIERKMAAKEPGDIELEAKGIRNQLDQLEQQNLNEISRMINNDAKQRENTEYIQRDAIASNIEKIVDKMPDFHGMNIGEGVAQSLADNYRQGKFNDLFKDPVFLAKSILYDKIGDSAFRRYGKTQYEKGARKQNENDHNVNGLTDNSSAGGGQRSGTSKGFSGWGQST